MKLFKNGVGRPSNETKRKRRNFVRAIILVCVMAIGGLSYLVINTFSNKDNESDKLKGEALYSSIPAASNIKYMKVDGGLVGWSLSGNKLKVGYYPYGDVNLDGMVSYKDAKTVLKMAAKLISGPSKGFKLALLDMDKNGKVTAGDARKILQISATNRKKDQYYCVSTEKGYCNWVDEDDSTVEKIYYLKKGTKYYVNSRKGYMYDENKIYSSDAITTNSSGEVSGNKQIVTHRNTVDLASTPFCSETDGTCVVPSSGRGVVEFYSNDGFSKVEYDTDLIRVRRMDKGEKTGYAKYKIYSKFKPIDREYYTAVSVITKNGARDTINVKVSGESIPNHNTKYWVKEKINGIPIYVDKECSGNKKLNEYLSNLKKLDKYVAGSVNYVEILTEKNYKAHNYPGAGSYYSNSNAVHLRCDYSDSAAVYHEFGHAIDYFYLKSTGNFLHNLSGFKKDFNISLNYSGKILNQQITKKGAVGDFFAEAFAAYMLIRKNGYTHSDLAKANKTVLIKNVVDLNWRIKNESMPAYNALYKTIFVD